MKTVVVLDRSPLAQLDSLLEQARRESIILRVEDGTEFLLARLGDFSQEIEAVHQNDDLMSFLEERAAEYATVSLEDAKSELGLT